MNLKINDKFSIENNDSCNYNLVEKYMTKPKEGQESKETTKVLGHYSSTLSALKAYVNRSLDDCGEVGNIIEHIKQLENKIEGLLK
jgi:hypothetical protein